MKHDDPHVPLPDEAIEAMAASWLAQREEGFTPEQETEFLRWRLADPRHGAAVDRLEETCALLEQLPLLRGDARLERPAAVTVAPVAAAAPVAPAVRRTWRSRWTVLGGAAAAIALAAFLWQHRAPASATATFTTTANRYERVLLPDSSVAQMNGGTQLRVDFTASERRVNLGEGEAHFHVAKDAARPFVVTVQGVRVIAVGTAFNIRVTDEAVDVIVTEGVVRVERVGPTTEAPLVLASGERAAVATHPAPAAALPVIERVAPAAMREALAWQQPRLVFVEAPLAEVIARFNERNRVQLELADAGLGARVVGGTFRPDDVETFVRLLESGGDIAADRRTDGRIVLRRAR